MPVYSPPLGVYPLGAYSVDPLYVTSATETMSEEDLAKAPLSGSLFAVETPFQGIAEPGFAG